MEIVIADPGFTERIDLKIKSLLLRGDASVSDEVRLDLRFRRILFLCHKPLGSDKIKVRKCFVEPFYKLFACNCQIESVNSLYRAPRRFQGRRSKVVNHPNRKKTDRAVRVTTSHRGVFFGYADKRDGETIKLRGARNCLYWPAEQKGFLGLASVGPVNGSRIGPAADIELRDITCVAECTDAATAAWEKAPCAR